MDKKTEDMEKRSDSMEMEDEDKKEEEYEDEKEDKDEEENIYIADNDWIMPIEFEEDVSNKDIIFRIKQEGGDVVFEDQSVDHEGKQVIFDVPAKLNKRLEAGKYKWIATLVDKETGKKTSTQPGCFYVEKF